MKHFLLLLFSILLLHLNGLSQRTDIIYFTDKNNSAFSTTQPLQYLSARSIQRRVNQNISIKVTDLPVNSWYIDSLLAKGADVWYTSKWFNAAIVKNANDSLINVFQSLPFVQNTARVRRHSFKVFEGIHKNDHNNLRVSNFDASFYGQSYNQNRMLGADSMHARGFAGQGMMIGVFDSGFPGVNLVPQLDSLRNRGGIKATWDFVSNNSNVYDDHDHGSLVLSTMASYAPGSIVGTAYMADYVLFRTEDVGSEYRVEEVNWLIAAEKADSIGVDLINTSLGYTTFDIPAQNYTYADMNGKTTIISRAAAHAASVGILPVVSAGNEGNGGWKYISAPADADSVISVGAVGPDSTIMSFSSRGPTSDNRIKPDLVAQGGATYVVYSNGAVGTNSGTSFSGPLTCGFAAGFWQANPTMTNLEVIERLRNTASRSTQPDTIYGYGIPNFIRAQNNIVGIRESGSSLSLKIYPNPNVDRILTIETDLLVNESSFDLVIFDNTGRSVYQLKTQVSGGIVRIQLPADLPEGLYNAQIRLTDRINITKLIIAD